MIRSLARILLGLLLATSALSFCGSLYGLTTTPLGHLFIERVGADLEAALERETARAATPEGVNARLDALLSEDPRNWLAIDAVQELATDRQIPLSAAITARSQTLRDEDFSVKSQVLGCLHCSWDPTTCSLSEVMICQIPLELLPVSDVFGVMRGGYNALTGGEIDKLDFALSGIGLAATAATLGSGGTAAPGTATVKVGTSALKTAKKMSLLSPRMTHMLTDVIDRGVDWKRATSLETIKDPRSLLRMDVLKPLAHVATDLGDIYAEVGATATLSLLKHIDTPADAGKIAKVAKVSGKKTLGRIEILGKPRLAKAMTRFTKRAVGLIGALVSTSLMLLSAGASALAALLKSLALRALRKAAR